MESVMNLILSPAGVILLLVVVTLKVCIKFVPQNRAYLVERFGKYHSTR